MSKILFPSFIFQLKGDYSTKSSEFLEKIFVCISSWGWEYCHTPEKTIIIKFLKPLPNTTLKNIYIMLDSKNYLFTLPYYRVS